MKNKALTEKERIEALSLHLGLSIRKLAKLINVNETTIYHITEKSRFGISPRTAAKLCYNIEKKLGIVVNRDWLLSGKGEMIDKELSTPVTYKPDGEGGITPVVAEPSADYGVDWKQKYIELLEKYTALVEKLSNQ